MQKRAKITPPVATPLTQYLQTPSPTQPANCVLWSFLHLIIVLLVIAGSLWAGRRQKFAQKLNVF